MNVKHRGIRSWAGKCFNAALIQKRRRILPPDHFMKLVYFYQTVFFPNFDNFSKFLWIFREVRCISLVMRFQILVFHVILMMWNFFNWLFLIFMSFGHISQLLMIVLIFYFFCIIPSFFKRQRPQFYLKQVHSDGPLFRYVRKSCNYVTQRHEITKQRFWKSRMRTFGIGFVIITIIIFSKQP